MNIKVISNGTIYGTHISDADTGERICGVQKFTIDADINTGICTVSLVMAGVPFEVHAPSETPAPPVIGPSDDPSESARAV